MLRASATIAALFACALPALAQPQALPAEQLKKIKAATVFVKVSHGPFGGTGSGFVVHAAKDYGLIVTNEHVVEPGERIRERLLPGAKATVEVVFNSGQGTAEWTVKAEVLHVNREDDLALLKVKALKPIPEPLALAGADKLPETTPVYVCGFPFGEDLAEGNKNPEISIGVASVSSNRTDAAGEVATVQLNGALNPGNSGGPVVTQDGKLVGVAVRTVTGAGIGFAVPPAKVRRAVQDIHFSPPVATWPDGPPRKIRLELRAVDAYGVLKNPTATIAPAPNAWATPNAGDIAAQAGAKAVPVTLTGDALATEFPVPEGTHFWLQFAWKDRAGAVRRSVPVRVATAEVAAKYPLPLRPGYERVAILPVKPRVDPLPAPPRPTPTPTPTPKAPRPNRTAPLGPDGKALPALATELAATPKGQIDLDELDRLADRKIGERLTVDILTTGVGSGWGDGPSLLGFNRSGVMPGKLDFVVDSALAQSLSGFDLVGQVGSRRIAVRIAGTLQKPAKPRGWQLFVVEEIGLLGQPNGTVVATYKRAAPHGTDPVVAPNGSFPNQTGNQVFARPEPYPLGGAEAQAQAYEELSRFNLNTIGKRYRFAVVYSTSSGSIHREGANQIPIRHLYVYKPSTDDQYRNLHIVAKPRTTDRLYSYTQLVQGGRLPCVVEFEPVGFFQPGKVINALDCRLISIRFWDPTKPGERIEIHEDLSDLVWPDPKIAIDKQAAPKPGGGGGAAAAPLPEEADGPSIPLIAGTVAVGALILGGIAWTIRRSNSRADRRAGAKRDRDDDRPRKRSRRSS